MLKKIKKWFGFPTVEDYQKVLFEKLEEMEKMVEKKPAKKAPAKKAPAKKKPATKKAPAKKKAPVKKSGGGGTIQQAL